jgi:hypothetical protein
MIRAALLFAASVGLHAQALGLQFYPVPPCRLVDTRGAAVGFDGASPWSGPSIAAQTAATFVLTQPSGNTTPSPCAALPAIAKAYVLNVTVVPKGGAVDYVTVWPDDQPQPTVALLDDPQAQIVSNLAVVSSGADGGISIFNAGPTSTDVVIDLAGYFATPYIQLLTGHYLSSPVVFYFAAPTGLPDAQIFSMYPCNGAAPDGSTIQRGSTMYVPGSAGGTSPADRTFVCMFAKGSDATTALWVLQSTAGAN